MTPTTQGSPTVKGTCPRCGRAVRAGNAYVLYHNGSHQVYQHVTCPPSEALAGLPTITADALAGMPYLTTQEAAALLRVSPSTIRLRIRRRQLPARRIRGGQTVLIRREDVEGLLEDIHGDPLPAAKAQPRKPKAKPVTDTLPPLALPEADRAQVLGEVLGGVTLSDIPTALLTRRPTDRNGRYPGGMAALRAEQDELKRRTSASL